MIGMVKNQLVPHLICFLISSTGLWIFELNLGSALYAEFGFKKPKTKCPFHQSPDSLSRIRLLTTEPLYFCQFFREPDKPRTKGLSTSAHERRTRLKKLDPDNMKQNSKPLSNTQKFQAFQLKIQATKLQNLKK